MTSVIKRYGTVIGQPKAAIIRTIEWNGTAPAPADFHGVTALVTAFATLYVQVQDEHGVPVPNADVEITFTKATADMVENAQNTAGSVVDGIVTGYGTAEGATVTNFFGGIQAVTNPAGAASLVTQSSITHLVTSNSYGEVVLKFAANPSTVDATAIHVRSGSAQIRITDLTGLTTNPAP